MISNGFPQHILMTADTVGGVWTYALELVKALEKYKVNVTLATMGTPLTPEQEAQVGTLANVQVRASEFKLEWMEEPWEDVREAGEWLLDLAAQIQPDLIHLNGYVHAALPWNAPVLVVGHSCVLSWWEAVKGEAVPASWSRYHKAVQQGVKAADAIAAPSRAMLAALHTHYGPFLKGSVIPNGRDRQLFYRDEKQDFILSVGRLWDEAKNVAALEAIAPEVFWPIYLAGEDKHPNGGNAHTEGRSPRVTRLGRLSPPTLSHWYARAAIYALPARYEPFGLSVLEAALSGCALVLGDIPSLREIWEDAALFVAPNEDKELAYQLNRLICDRESRQQWADRAYTRALDFTSDRMAASYLALYQVLLGVQPVGDRQEKRETAYRI